MLIPEKNYCFELYKKYEVPPHIVEHSMRVAQVGLYLTKRLSKAGISLDEKLVETSSLLHDLAKMECIRKGGDHAKMACDILYSLGFPEVGDILRQHVILDAPFSEINETVIVNYSDKRVRHTEIVSLEDRFEYIFERYGKESNLKDKIMIVFSRTKNIESEIFKKLPFQPEKLNELNLVDPGY